MKNSKKENICKNCKSWKPNQAELEYSSIYGICVASNFSFDISKEKDAVVLDRGNITKVHMGVNRFENTSDVVPIGRVEKSRYCLVTAGDFGCINFK